ncbi:MAG: helix-turn-helix domain-containing protein [Cytophagales bacterium]|nr:helix-turn-helix domain-containing protein [Cytophagales bacterium]
MNNEAQESLATSNADVEPAAQSTSAGQLIKEARLASGMHIGTLSMALKVPVKKLEALESEDWSQLSDMVFVRALAISVCRQIKTDSAPILAALPQLSTESRTIHPSEKGMLNTSFRTPSEQKFSWSKLPISMPLMVGALVLLLAAVVLIFLPTKTQTVEASNANANPTVPAAPAIPVAQPMPVVATPVSAETVAPAAVNTPSSATSAVAAVPAAPTTTPSSVGGSILRMEAKGEVWVEVKDSKGTLIVHRTLKPKETVNVSGQPPLAVVIGRINEIASVSVRGKPFDISAISPDNVARFEVK